MKLIKMFKKMAPVEGRTHQAVISVILTCTHHDTPVQVLRKGLHTSLIIHDRNSDALQPWTVVC